MSLTLSRYIRSTEIDKISSLVLIEFILEWNRVLDIVAKINEKEPELGVRLSLVLDKTSKVTYTLKRVYQEGGFITVEDYLEIYGNSKAYSDVLNMYVNR